MRPLVLVAMLLLVSACRKESVAVDPAPTVPSASVAKASASAPSASASAARVGPAPGSADRAARETAVTALILGGKATALPERSTDPSASFDDNLRDKLAPRKAPPVMRQTKLDVSAGLPPEVVTRIARANFPRLRSCYENRLEANPKLEGAVTVAFTIDREGQVKGAKDSGSTIGDAELVGCMTRVLGSLSFPKPERDTVQVTYALELKPSS